jgi:peptidyl-prolyl cis-trans isomerase B (cyclophilin B)
LAAQLGTGGKRAYYNTMKGEPLLPFPRKFIFQLGSCRNLDGSAAIYRAFYTFTAIEGAINRRATIKIEGAINGSASNRGRDKSPRYHHQVLLAIYPNFHRWKTNPQPQERINLKSIHNRALSFLLGASLIIGAIVVVTAASSKAEPTGAGAKLTPPTAADLGDTTEVAVISTAKGDITVEFFPSLAPMHVANFKKLARAGFYDGTTFHRVIPGFVIQGGDPNTKDSDPTNDGMGGPGYTVKAEFNSTLHVKGILSMARSSDPNSAGSQFFICLGRAEHLDNQYTVFGKVIKGIEVVDAIGSVARNPMDPHERTMPAVAMKSVRIVKRSSIAGLDASSAADKDKAAKDKSAKEKSTKNKAPKEKAKDAPAANPDDKKTGN